MVEMVETAAILNQAGSRSLVILDEIGRGTATFDGLSIAWATVEHLHDVNKCRALFATHFPRTHRSVGAAQAAAQRHRAGEGMAGRGGVPPRSRARLRRPLLWYPGGETRRLAGKRHRARAAGARQTGGGRPRQAEGLRGSAAVCASLAAPVKRDDDADRIAAAIAALNPDEMSPREAMDALYALKANLPKPRES